MIVARFDQSLFSERFFDFQVVAIIEKKHSRASSGSLRIFQAKNPNYFLFSPVDSRVPRMMIPANEAPPGEIRPSLCLVSMCSFVSRHLGCYEYFKHFHFNYQTMHSAD